ncbi:MAG TPA: penicillin-binding transpeptidase domain-containing protein [Ktedonobacterales bacterium]
MEKVSLMDHNVPEDGSEDQRGPRELDNRGAAESNAPGGLTPTEAPDSERTVELSPDVMAAMAARRAPQRAAPITRAPSQPSQPKGPPIWAYLVTTLVVIGLIVGATYTLIQANRGPGSTTGPAGCGTSSACAAANAYIADFTGGKYEALYTLTSQASRTRFSDPAILHAGAKYAINAVDYTDARDYITSRTKYIVQAAAIDSMAATTGATHVVSATQATVPVRLIMTSARVGAIAEDITIPLRLEGKSWKVDWSPGLIFPQLDSSADSTYTNVVRLVTAGYEGQRGAIYDAEGDALAKDGTVYQIQVCPSQIKSQSAVFAALTSKIDLTQGEITNAYQGQDPKQCYTVRTIADTLYTSVSVALNLPGIQAQQAIGREYHYGATTAAVTGYVGQVSQQDLNNDTSHYYQAGDIIGRAGVEQWGETYLRPLKGGKLVIRARNADGSDGPVQASIAERQAVNGDDIHTFINIGAQQAAMKAALAESQYSSGAVAVDPETGAVLVMISNPIYDPNDLSLGLTANAQARLNAMNHPYLNRAVQTADPIGSVLKLVTLATGLQNGVTPTQIFTCPGFFTLPGVTHVFIDDNPNGHGSLTAPKALAPSCDVVFWKIGQMMNDKDPNILPNEVKGFGFGAPTGMIGLPSGVENPGTVPDPTWIQQNENASWTAVDAVNLAVGQGFFQATPAQVAMSTAAIANGGKRLLPRLIDTVTDTTGAKVFVSQYKQVGTLPVSAANLQVIQVAMLGPIHDSDGTTARDFLNYPINVAGKTGTAESGQPLPQSWFTCFAPASPITGNPVTPTVTIAALVEHSLSGEKNAVPITKAIMDNLFNLPPGT